LLAGDALLTEAYLILGQYYSNRPEIGLELTKLLAEASGLTGMIGGQEIDIYFQTRPQQVAKMTKEMKLAAMERMHALKTSALIRISAEGAAVLGRMPQDKRQRVRRVRELLGFAFQLTDDILDYQDALDAGTFSQAE